MIRDAQDAVTDLYARIFGPDEEPTTGDLGEPTGVGDDEALNQLAGFKNGATTRQLADGDNLHHISGSEADLDYAARLAFVCGNDPEQIERLMRRSGRYRLKWDQHPTYLRDTIMKAIAGREGKF